MLPVALLVGLDVVQADACRSVLGDRARVIAVLEAEDGVQLLSLHRPFLIVMRTDLFLHERIILSNLAEKTGARAVSIGPLASPACVEHLVEGVASITFATSMGGDERAADRAPPPKSSGTRARVSPGEYHLATPRTPFVSSKAKR